VERDVPKPFAQRGDDPVQQPRVGRDIHAQPAHIDTIAAQALLEGKTRAVQAQGPKVIAAMADFYDSLTPAQQAKVRERMDKGGHRGWGRG